MSFVRRAYRDGRRRRSRSDRAVPIRGCARRRIPRRRARRRHSARQQPLVRGGAEDHPRARPRRARDLRPQVREFGVVHPVLRVEQHVAIEARGRTVAQSLGERALGEADPIGARAQRLEIALLQVGRQRSVRAAGVAAPERLPGEIVRVDVEVAGEPLQPLAQHRADAVGRILRQRTVLRRRDAEPVERGGLAHQPAHRRLVEDRREMPIEQDALVRQGIRLQHDARIETMQARERVSGAQKAPEQAVTIEIAREQRDAPAPADSARVPIGAGDGIDAMAKQRRRRPARWRASRRGRKTAGTLRGRADAATRPV